MSYFYLLGTILLTTYGQLIIKWRITLYHDAPHELFYKLVYFVKIIFTDYFVFSGFCAAFLASLFWILAMTKFSVSFAYPFMGAAFVLVLVLSGLLLNEQITAPKIIGALFIITGIAVSSLSRC